MTWLLFFIWWLVGCYGMFKWAVYKNDEPVLYLGEIPCIMFAGIVGPISFLFMVDWDKMVYDKRTKK